MSAVAGNKERAVALLRALASGDADGAVALVDQSRFVRHDPDLGDGVAGLRARAAAPSGSIDVARMLADGDLVVAHGREGDEVFFAAFRFADGLVAEAWRFAVPAAPPNTGGHTQTDGPTGPDRAAGTAATKAVVRDYYETVHLGGDHGAIHRFMADDVQVRHEPGVRDGVAAFEADLAVLTRERTIDGIVLFAGEGDLVFLLARGTHQGRPCAYLDLYRVERGKLVEHWGFPQELPPSAAWKNGAGPL